VVSLWQAVWMGKHLLHMYGDYLSFFMIVPRKLKYFRHVLAILVTLEHFATLVSLTFNWSYCWHFLIFLGQVHLAFPQYFRPIWYPTLSTHTLLTLPNLIMQPLPWTSPATMRTYLYPYEFVFFWWLIIFSGTWTLRSVSLSTIRTPKWLSMCLGGQSRW
jgi:hypothetical protein